MVITSLTRNQVARKGSWVRIPPPPPNALKAHAFRAFSCQNVPAVVLPVVFDAPLFDAFQIFLFAYMNNNYRRDALNDARIS